MTKTKTFNSTDFIEMPLAAPAAVPPEMQGAYAKLMAGRIDRLAYGWRDGNNKPQVSRERLNRHYSAQFANSLEGRIVAKVGPPASAALRTTVLPPRPAAADRHQHRRNALRRGRTSATATKQTIPQQKVEAGAELTQEYLHAGRPAIASAVP